MTTTTTSQRSDPTFLNIIHGSTHFLGPRRQPASSTCCPSTFAHDSEINRVQRQTAFLHGCQPGRTTTQGRQDRRERGMRETSRVHSWNDENQAHPWQQKRSIPHPTPKFSLRAKPFPLPLCTQVNQSINDSDKLPPDSHRTDGAPHQTPLSRSPQPCPLRAEQPQDSTRRDERKPSKAKRVERDRITNKGQKQTERPATPLPSQRVQLEQTNEKIEGKAY
ncbi:hypothetical protein IWX50DRAFT_237199 [Phyllosticta citricarpa]